MFIQSFWARLVALVLVAAIALTGCAAGTATLSGDYRQDTLTVIADLTEVMSLPTDAENKSELEAHARQEMNDYAALYRRDNRVAGLRSFTTMQTAINGLAGFYGSYGSRPVPEKLKKRLAQEFQDVQLSLKRGF
ncbi:MAG: photosystem II protein Psb27 [Spirulinaceae cyanobacterium RM2_2_10]|nr:photosystem II protein Psb27 [Spirulinaceae cyanobacterium SM2_1_0]NJO19619.1 photosystem II protein Psb27 [Spirulinaceae cyanobacterium RM2_2_10]